MLKTANALIFLFIRAQSHFNATKRHTKILFDPSRETELKEIGETEGAP